MSENKSLIKSTRIIGLATLASRILGFVRDVLIAKFFGTGASAQAFVVSFRIPNLLRSVIGEGSANATVVPVLSRLNEEGKKEEFWQVAGCLLNILIVFLAVLTLLGQFCAPAIVRAIAPGFISEPSKLELTIRLTRWIFPYLLLVGLSAFAMAVLNSLKHFALPALAPCMLNISLIVSILIVSPRLKEGTFALVWGVLIGGVLQLAIQVPLLLKKGLLRGGSFRFFHPQVKKIGKLFLPRTLGIAIYQLNIFVDTILASLAWIVGTGAVAALYYANRIIQFPLALFALALAQAALPTMSALALDKDLTRLKKTISFSLRSVFTIMLPATVGIMVLAHPLAKIIFERGSFTSFSTGITSSVLFFYCLGLAGYAGIKILASSFYSLQDTATPAKIAGLALAVNVILNLILMWPMRVAGLALATAISVTVNFILLLWALNKKIGRIELVLSTLGKVVLAASIMGVPLWFIFYRADIILGIGIPSFLKLGLAIFVGLAVYLGALKVFAREEAEIFVGWILRRK
ncbi:MAG: murein biosynthesis integral membrane protein MurJ [Omnitrophica bacterium]|nr:murein biosynthesis integral membrane protein MurJ [Candidatus Omnitrophota bacterium]